MNFEREALQAAVVATTRCPLCLEGSLERRHGRKGDFYGCSLYPYCEGTAVPCPECGEGPLINDGSRHRCSNSGCAFEAATCPECGVGYLKLNLKGAYGPFYGCTNWRGDGQASCTHKRKVRQRVEN